MEWKGAFTAHLFLFIYLGWLGTYLDPDLDQFPSFSLVYAKPYLLPRGYQRGRGMYLVLSLLITQIFMTCMPFVFSDILLVSITGRCRKIYSLSCLN